MGSPQLLVVVHEYLGAEDEVKLFDLHDVDILPEFLGNCNQEKSIVRKGFFLTKKKRYCSVLFKYTSKL